MFYTEHFAFHKYAEGDSAWMEAETVIRPILSRRIEKPLDDCRNLCREREKT